MTEAWEVMVVSYYGDKPLATGWGWEPFAATEFASIQSIYLRRRVDVTEMAQPLTGTPDDPSDPSGQEASQKH